MPRKIRVDFDHSKPERLTLEVRQALRRAEESGVEVHFFMTSTHWCCAVEGDVVHINDFSKALDHALGRRASRVA